MSSHRRPADRVLLDLVLSEARLRDGTAKTEDSRPSLLRADSGTSCGMTIHRMPAIALYAKAESPARDRLFRCRSLAAPQHVATAAEEE